jgi:ribose-phosphate pyrophosphokinase
MVAELLETVGVSQVITIDLHAAQIEGFFHAPVDSLSAVPTLAAILRDSLAPGTVVVSPDAGRIHMAGEYAQRLGTSVVVLHKQRVNGSKTHVTHVVGDVRNRPCLIIDDMISTGNTIAVGIAALKAAGAAPSFTVAATHGILLPNARERITEAGVNLVYVTDTVAMHHREWTQLGVVSVAPLIAAAIRRISTNGSLSELYE